jgi:organic radical activating enzyme
MSYSDKEFRKIKTITEKLDQVSDSFCLVRWKHATINLATGTSKSCCHHEFKKIAKTDMGFQLHDNLEEQELRAKMLKGEKTKDCQYCWWIEDNGDISDRQSWSAKSWMSPFFSDVKEELSAKASTPSWVELNFSSVCNLKCAYCSPIFSTQWYKEIKKHGPYPTSIPFNSIRGLKNLQFEDNYENSELIKRFDQWFYEVLPGIRLLKITGGEPFLSRQTFELMDRLSQSSHPHLTLGINSNLSLPEDKWDRFLSYLEKIEKSHGVDRFYLHPSIDCFGERAEYIRYGLDMELFTNNVEKYLEKSTSHLHFISTLTNLALGSWLDFWKWVYHLKQTYYKEGREINVGTEVLSHPEWLNLNLLPPSYDIYFQEVISFISDHIDESGKGFNRVELEGVKKARNAFKSEPQQQHRSKSDFYKYVNEMDNRRGLNFQKTFPELQHFYADCVN